MGLQRVGYDRAYTHVTVLEAIFWILVPAPACHMDISNRAQYFKCSCPACVNKDHAHLRSGFCWSGHLAKNTPSFVFAGRVVLPSRSPRWCYLSSVSVSFLFFFFPFFFWSCWHLPVTLRLMSVSFILVESFWWLGEWCQRCQRCFQWEIILPSGYLKML